MRKLLPLLAAAAVTLFAAAAAVADTPAAAPAGPAVIAQAPVSVAQATNAPLGMGLSVIGVGIGLGLIGYGAMSGIARQPEQADNIRTAMLIIGGLVEGAGIIGLVLCLVAR